MTGVQTCALPIYPHEITFCILGPHTTFAYLLQKHPDATALVKNVLMMGGAPMGIATNPNHNSFNIRTDAPAFKYTVDSGLPVFMVPSSIGRDHAHFTEAQVERLKSINDVGKFLAKTYETYWEPNYPDRRISNNDIAALYYLLFPRLFKMKRAFIDLNLETGKTTAKFSRHGNFKIALGLKRDKFIKIIFNKLEEMNGIKLPELSKQQKSAKIPSWETTHSEKRMQNKKAATKKASEKTVKTKASAQQKTAKTNLKSKKKKKASTDVSFLKESTYASRLSTILQRKFQGFDFRQFSQREKQ